MQRGEGAGLVLPDYRSLLSFSVHLEKVALLSTLMTLGSLPGRTLSQVGNQSHRCLLLCRQKSGDSQAPRIRDKPFSPLATVGCCYHCFLGTEGNPFGSSCCGAFTSGAGQAKAVVNSHPQRDPGKGGEVRWGQEGRRSEGSHRYFCILGRGRLIRVPHPTCGSYGYWLCALSCVSPSLVG